MRPTNRWSLKSSPGNRLWPGRWMVRSTTRRRSWRCSCGIGCERYWGNVSPCLISPIGLIGLIGPMGVIGQTETLPTGERLTQFVSESERNEDSRTRCGRYARKDAAIGTGGGAQIRLGPPDDAAADG